PFSLQCDVHLRDLHSFPTRRSSDLPKDLQKLILKGEEPYIERPNAHMAPLDIDAEYKEFRNKFEQDLSRPINITDFLSYKLYPKDRKSTRLNSSHVKISYAVFCLKK